MTGEKKASANEPAAIFQDAEEHASWTRRRLSELRRQLAAAHERGKWEQARDAFDKTGNPVFAYSALANWPPDEPISGNVLDWLRLTGREIERISLRVVGRDSPMSVADASQAILRALGFVRGRWKGSNTLAEARRDALARTITEARHIMRTERPALSEKQIVGVIAGRMGMSDANVRRYIRAGEKLIGKLPPRRNAQKRP